MNTTSNNIVQDLTQAFKSGEPGLAEFFISILLALVAGIVSMYLYRLYFSDVSDRNESLEKSFVIISPSICAIFWAIQYSLPLSLGLLGALSFVRFRNPIKRAEDIGFILLVIAIALLASIYRFNAATSLLIMMALIVFGKSFFKQRAFSLLKGNEFLSLFIQTSSKDLEALHEQLKGKLSDEFTDLLSPEKITINDIVTSEQGYNLRYTLALKGYSDDLTPRIITIINSIDGIEQAEVFLEKNK